jgi:hypothetical protein
MLKITFALLLLTFSLSSLACWKVDGQYSVDGEDYKISQKVDHDKEYSFPMGTFILNMTVSSKNKKQTVVYTVHEKKGTVMTLVTKGTENLEMNKSKDIYAKGEKDQPNTILTLKLSEI